MGGGGSLQIHLPEDAALLRFIEGDPVELVLAGRADREGAKRGAPTGPNPTDRAKSGSKRHLGSRSFMQRWKAEALEGREDAELAEPVPSAPRSMGSQAGQLLRPVLPGKRAHCLLGRALVKKRF